jgi:hypothetical protein
LCCQKTNGFFVTTGRCGRPDPGAKKKARIEIQPVFKSNIL